MKFAKIKNLGCTNKFIMHKKLLLTMFCVSICVLSTNTNDDQESEQELCDSIDYEAEKKAVGKELKKNPWKREELLQRLFEKRKELEFKRTFKKNLLKYFMIYFNDFLKHEIIELEVYKNVTKNLLYQKRDFKTPIFPQYIEDIIRDNDDWINLYDAKDISYKYSEYSDSEIMSIEPSTSTSASTRSIPALVESIAETFKNWYLTVTYTGNGCPQFVENIQNKLKRLYIDNRNKYESLDETYRRFAACIARSYKMMCVLHHKVIIEMENILKRNRTASFTNLLFACVPSLYITYEEWHFLNVLRRSIEPKITPLKYFKIKNRPKSPESDRKWTIIPYDDYVQYRKNTKPFLTTQMTTYAFYPMD